jgi:hypothetical protein
MYIVDLLAIHLVDCAPEGRLTRRANQAHNRIIENYTACASQWQRAFCLGWGKSQRRFCLAEICSLHFHQI